MSFASAAFATLLLILCVACMLQGQASTAISIFRLECAREVGNVLMGVYATRASANRGFAAHFVLTVTIYAVQYHATG